MAAALERSGLDYLARHSASRETLRRVLQRRVLRWLRDGRLPPDLAEAAERRREELILRWQRAGLLDDAAFAAARARGLRLRGSSARRIRAVLAEKGVEPELVERALETADAEAAIAGDGDLAAAAALARRRRLGPFRAGPERAGRRARDLAALSRAGFPFATARRVIDAADPAALEALLREATEPG